MLHLLDSSVVIDVLRNRAAVSDLPLPSLAKVSSIVAAELWTGAMKNRALPGKIEKVEEFLELFPVIPFDDNAARHYGDIRTELEKSGVSIGPLDLLIAAHARSLGATLITGNAKEFRRVKGLKLLAWK